MDKPSQLPNPPNSHKPPELSKSLSVCVLIVLSQQVRSEITLEVTPYAVDMVCIILSVVVLDQECRTLDAIVMRLAAFGAAGPRERDVSESGSTDSLDSGRGDFWRHVVRVA